MTHVTIVTGGSSGIGAAIARRSAETGREVLIVSRRPGPVGRHLPLDLSDPSTWVTLGDHLAGELAHARSAELFHCAATLTPIGFAGETDPEAYRDNILLNAAAPLVIGERFLRAAASIPATLVLISSGAARTPYPGWSGYCAGKAAVDMWVRTVGDEQAQRHGVKVLSIAPGVVDTDMQAEIRASDEHDFPKVERFRRLHEEGDLGEPDDVARRILDALPRLASGTVADLRDL